MRWRRIALWLSFGTLALLVLALAWLWTADLGVFKPQLERFVTENTGREFAIDGEFHVDLGQQTSVIAERVRFRNAEWADPADMVTVDRIEIRFNLWSLFKGPILIELIDVDGATVSLISPQTGDPNWVLPIEEQSVPAEEEAGPGFLVEQILVDNARLEIVSADRTRPLGLQLHAFRQQQREDGRLDLYLDALLDGRTVKLNGELGPWDALLAGKEIRFDLEADLDTFELSASGYFDDLANPVYPEIRFTATGPDINDLTRLLGLGEEGGGDIKLAGSLQKSANDRLILEVDGNVGRAEIHARGSVSDLQNLRNVDIEIQTSGPDLGNILRLFGIHQVREAPFSLRVDAETRGDTFVVNEANLQFAGARIDVEARMPRFPSIDDAVVSLLVEGPDIARFRYLTGLPGAAEGAFSLRFTSQVNDQGVEFLRLEVETALLEARANGRLGEPPDFYSSQVNFQIGSDSLQRLASAYGIGGMPNYPIEVNGSVEYDERGLRTIKPLVATLDQVSASIDGFVTLVRGASGSELSFALDGSDLAGLVGMFGNKKGVPEEAYDLRGRIQVHDDGYRFREVEGSVGHSVIEADGLLTTAPGLAGTRFDFSIAGPALEDVIDHIGDFRTRRGSYELSGSVDMQRGLLRLRKFRFERPFGSIMADLDLGLPVTRKWLDFDVRGSGIDVRTLLQGMRRFEAHEQPFSLDVRGNLRGDHLTFDKVDIGVGEATLKSQGDLALYQEKANTEFTFNLAVPSLARLGMIDGRGFNDQGFSLFAHVVGGDGILTVDQLAAKLGESDIRGNVRLQKGNVPDLDVDVFSDSVIFAPLLEEAVFEYDPAPRFDDGRFVPDVFVPFDAMRTINASVDIDIGALQVGSIVMKDIAFDAILHDGGLEVSRAGFAARSGTLHARAKLEPAGDSGAATLEIVARSFAPGIAESNIDLAMTSNIEIRLDSTGADLRTLLGNASGIVFLDGRGGRMSSNRWLQRLYGDVLQEILSTINPFRKTDPYTDFECIVMPLKLKSGVLTSAPSIFVSTNRIRIAANPSINFKTEDLSVLVRTTPRGSLTISAGELVNPYVKIVGTLASPGLAVDEKGVLITGGAAIATGGLTLLARGVWDRLSLTGDPCAQASENALAELNVSFPDLGTESPERRE